MAMFQAQAAVRARDNPCARAVFANVKGYLNFAIGAGADMGLHVGRGKARIAIIASD